MMRGTGSPAGGMRPIAEEEAIFDEENMQQLLLSKALPPPSPLADRALGERPPAEEEAEARKLGELSGGTRFCRHRLGCWSNCRRGFYKGFWMGLAIKGGINALTAAAFRGLWRRPRALLAHALGSDANRFGLFWGLFTAGFKGLQCLLRRLRGREDWINSFVAAAAASAAVVVDEPQRQVTWALWMLARAGDLAWRHFGALGYLPVSQYGDVIAFTLASGAVMYAWQLEPYALGQGYRRWISDRGGLDERVISGVSEVVRGRTPDMTSWCADNQIPNWNALRPRDAPPPSRLPCAVFHPLEGRSCTLHAVKRWFLGFRAGLPVYLTVHLLPLVLFRFRRLAASPVPVLRHAALSVFYSTSFITSFQTIYWFVFCHSRNLIGRDQPLSTVLAGHAAGLSLLCERPGRRPELALFTIPRALACSWIMLRRYGLVRDVPGGHVAIFALAMGCIMSFYQHRPSVIKGAYLRLMQRYFGTN